MAKKKVNVEKVIKIVNDVPWSDVVKLTAKIVSFSRGGLTPDEAKELAKDLIDLSNKLLGEVEKCEVP